MWDRERNLARENDTLKADLQTATYAIRRYQAGYQQQRRTNQTLVVENQELRRLLESNGDSEERQREATRDLRHRNTRLQNENDGLKGRIQQLTQRLRDAVDDRIRELKENVADLTAQIGVWRRQHEDLERRYQRMRTNLDEHVRTNDRLRRENDVLRRRNSDYERILDRNRRQAL
jgi:chromosome segregation ATPase